MHQEAAALSETARMRVQEDKRTGEVGKMHQHVTQQPASANEGGKARIDNNQGIIYYRTFEGGSQGLAEEIAGVGN